MARKAVGNVGTQARPQSSNIMQQLKRFNTNQTKRAKPSATPIARMPKAAKTDTPRSVIPRGPKGIAPPLQQDAVTQDFMKKRRQMPQRMQGGFTYGRSARGAMGSRGRQNQKAPIMQQALPMQRQGQMSLLGRQYSKGGLLKSASKLNTGIKSGK